MIGSATSADRTDVAKSAMLLGCVVTLAAAVAADRAVAAAAALTVVVAILALTLPFLLRWEVMLAGIVMIILFVPIKRYKLPGNVPFDIEPYRIVVALVLGLWLAALLVDSRVVLRRTFLDPPLLAIGATVLGSILTNFARVSGEDQDPAFSNNLSLADEVAKALVLLVSFVLVYYMVASLVSDMARLHFLVKALVGGATVVAVFALIEARSGFNIFNHITTVMPFLSFDPSIAGEINRGGNARVYASAQSPIALGAMFVMMLPLALYLARVTGRRRWWVAFSAIALGSLSSLSRTGALMFIVAVVVFLVLRSAEVRRFVPLIVPALVVIHFTLPGAIGSYKQAFFPSEGLREEQTVGQGRVSSARLDPQFEAISGQPLLGIGYGTRVTDGPTQNAFILDNQWLGTTVETGFLGTAAWAWFFVRFVRRVGGEARRDRTSRGLLLTGLVSAIAGFGLSMLTYDAFSFIQATVVMLVLAAIGARVIEGDFWADAVGPDPVADRFPGAPV